MSDSATLITFLIDPLSPNSNRFRASLAGTDPSLFEIVAPRIGDDWGSSLNEAIARAQGRFVCVVSGDDRLRPDAVAVLSETLTDETDVLYSDQIEDNRVVRKPMFSPERLRSQFYLGALVVYRRALVEKLGRFATDVPGCEQYDLALRATEVARLVAHVAQPLIAVGAPMSAEANESTVVESITRTLQRHLDRTGGGEILSASSQLSDTRRIVNGSPLVSIIIPTRGDSAEIRGETRCLVVEAVRSVLDKSTYKNIEFVVVFDESTPEQVLDELRGLAPTRMRLVPWLRPFSFSGKINLGVVHARGELVLFLNDDTEVVTPEWIEAMLALAQRPEAGIVGAFLFFENETIQHAGHAYYEYGVTHIGLNSPRGAAGPGDAFLVEREVDGVTAACALMRRDVFFEVGGFSPLLPGNFNDVDLSMKLAAKGYRAYVTPHAQLYHFESKSRNPKVAGYEVEIAWGRWEHLFGLDTHAPEEPDEVYHSEMVEADWMA